MSKLNKQDNIKNILLTEQGSALDKYHMLTAGNVSRLHFLLYELVTWLLSSRSGALGILLRRKFYKYFFKDFGRNIIIGRNCTFRHPGKISLGDNVVIDDNCLIDARGAEKAVTLSNNVIINRDCSIQSKGGDIVFSEGVTVGNNGQLVSWSGLAIQEGTAIAGGCIISAGTYKMDDFKMPLDQREPLSAGPIEIGSNVWVATRVTLLDGVKIGDNAIISAGAVVTNDIEAMAVAHGNPAKVVFKGR